MSPHADPVTPELREEIIRLDGFRCVARLIAVQMHEPIDACRDQWGSYVSGSPRYPATALTLDHVPDTGGSKKGMSIAGQRKGKRAPSDVKHLVTICWHHHLNGWATGHRDLLRAYLANRSGAPL